MGLFYNYQKSGKGVSKDEKTTNRLALFFQIYVTKIWKMVELSLLYAIVCIPVVTIGPATAGLVKVLRNYSLQKHAYLWSDFWEGFKKNFKNSFLIGIANTILFAGIILGLLVYPNLAGKNSALFYLPMIISLSIGVTLIIMNFYLYLMIVSIDIPLKDIIKNSFILACVELKKNILTLFALLIVCGALFGLIWINIFNIIFYPLIGASLIWFIIVFNSYPAIQKHIINPYYESKGLENPEYEYLKINDGENIFTDKGGKESAVQIEKKGKTIS